MDVSLEQAQSFNAAAFVLHHKIVNENQVPITFKHHPFLAAPYMDMSERVVAIKASQIGFSTLAIIRALHFAKFINANVIYTLPSMNAVKDFVTPKIDPLIEHNPAIKSFVGHKDTTALKKIGDRFVYFRSSWDKSKAISISADILIEDEVNFSNQEVLESFESRLHASKLHRPDLGFVWRFSNPTVPGKGVDNDWQESDKKHWFIKCSRCNHRQCLDWPDSIDVHKEIFICQKCKKELRQEDRGRGTWVKKHFGRDISGYWYNRLMAPWVTAKVIIAESKKDPAFFHNFTLGKSYATKDDMLTRESITKCLIPGYNPQTDVAIGVDNAVTKTYVVGNKYGIFRIGKTDDFREIEAMRNRYNAYMVCDANPHPAWVKKLVEKYPGKVYMHYYQEDRKQLGIIRWGENDKKGVVYSDRTRIIDAVVADINAQDIIFNLTVTDLENEGFIQECMNIYRTVVENAKGMTIPTWQRVEGKHDDYLHALIYWKIAMQKTLSHGEITRSPQNQQTDFIENSAQPVVDFTKLLEEMDQAPSKGWKVN